MIVDGIMKWSHYISEDWQSESGSWGQLTPIRAISFTVWQISINTRGSTSRQRDYTSPVFFFAGRYDYTTPSVLVEEFSTALRAPFKKLIWFEQSAHMPNIEEPEKFQRELIAIAHEWCSENQALKRSSAT